MKELVKKIVYKAPLLGRLKNEIISLQKQNKTIEDTMNKAQIERDKVYEGNLKLEEELNLLKFRIKELDKLHEEVVLRNWSGNSPRKKLTCKNPFERIEILPTGDVYTCCSAHLKHNFSIGNIYKNTLEEIWNSDNAKKLRYSVTMGDFEFCNNMCMWLHDNSDNICEEIKPIRLRKDIKEEYEKYDNCYLDYMPKEISLSCDYSCNLTCPSCRTKLGVLDKQESDLLYEKLIKFVRPALKDCTHLSSLGSGDIFASSALSKFYKTLKKSEFPNLNLLIITNAQLLTEQKWKEFSNLKEFPLNLVVSIDASKKDTYEKIRRGGNWENLNKNLEFISSLRQNKSIQKLTFNFLIQKENYTEMEEFIDFSKKYNIDIIEFQKMANWGTFDDEVFINTNVLHQKNPLRQEIVNRLKKIIRETKEIVIIQNIV